MAQASASHIDTVAESHRAFVREMNRRVQRVYALGGLLALLSGASVLEVAWSLGALFTLAPWPLSILTFLVMLFFVRDRIRKELQTLERRVLEFADMNELEVDVLYNYYESDDLFSFFMLLRNAARHASLPEGPA